MLCLRTSVIHQTYAFREISLRIYRPCSICNMFSNHTRSTPSLDLRYYDDYAGMELASALSSVIVLSPSCV